MNSINYDERYPTYSCKERDVVLVELEKAHQVANSQHAYLQYVLGILVTLATASVPLLSNPNVKLPSVDITLFLVIVVVAYLIIRYIAELQKSIVISTRKVIVLRQMLGLDYGNTNMVLPNWRVEGATNPFAVKIFPGWKFRYPVMLAFWFVVFIVDIFLFYNTPEYSRYIYMVILTSIMMVSFRRALFDTNENNQLLLAKFIAFILRIKLVDDTEYIIYRAKLAVAEIYRLNYDLENLKTTLIAIEDKNFYKHRGIALSSLMRGVISNSKIIRGRYGIIRSGGSTINMQLARSLFIKDYSKRNRRKIIEIFLAKWIDIVLSKNDILEIYLASVRFDNNIYGLPAASMHFYNNSSKKIYSDEEALFLIERVSNISGTYNTKRLKYLSNKIGKIDFDKLVLLYKSSQIRESTDTQT